MLQKKGSILRTACTNPTLRNILFATTYIARKLLTCLIKLSMLLLLIVMGSVVITSLTGMLLPMMLHRSFLHKICSPLIVDVPVQSLNGCSTFLSPNIQCRGSFLFLTAFILTGNGQLLQLYFISATNLPPVKNCGFTQREAIILYI